MKLKLPLILALTCLTSVISTTTAVAADAALGKSIYTTCGVCHGQNGEGMQALNAPALAGQAEWYVIRQLNNFKQGIRGANPKDTYGMQMAPMAQILATDADVENVAAYIATLGR